MIKRILLLISYLMLASANLAWANQLNEIYYDLTQDGNYAVTFLIDDQVNYQLINTNDEVVIDFAEIKFSVKNLSKKLNSKFIKSISKINEDSDNLRVILKMANNVNLVNNYSVNQNDKSFVVIVFSNKNNDEKTGAEEIKPVNKFVIMIDPGHGGLDKGAISTNLHILEKNLTLEYAKELKRELSKYPQYKVLLTREKDEFLSPATRLKKAKAEKADIFISLHADFHSNSKMRGASIYTLPQESITQETMALIEQKNKNNLLKNNDLLKENEQIAGVLLNMVYQDTQNSSINLAKATTEALNEEVEMLKKSRRALELKVLKGVDTPGILIELGYLSNLDEEKQLNSVQHRKLFTQALVQGVNQYWQKLK